MFTSTYRTLMAILLSVTLIVVPVKQAEAFIFFLVKKSAQKNAIKRIVKQANKPVSKPKRIAQRIGNGHASKKHLPKDLKSSGIKNKRDMINRAAGTIKNGIKKPLSNDRTAYFQPEKRFGKAGKKGESGNLVIHDKRSKDGGTMFHTSRDYFNKMK